MKIVLESDAYTRKGLQDSFKHEDKMNVELGNTFLNEVIDISSNKTELNDQMNEIINGLYSYEWAQGSLLPNPLPEIESDFKPYQFSIFNYFYDSLNYCSGNRFNVKLIDPTTKNSLTLAVLQIVCQGTIQNSGKSYAFGPPGRKTTFSIQTTKSHYYVAGYEYLVTNIASLNEEDKSIAELFKKMLYGHNICIIC